VSQSFQVLAFPQSGPQMRRRNVWHSRTFSRQSFCYLSLNVGFDYLDIAFHVFPPKLTTCSLSSTYPSDNLRSLDQQYRTSNPGASQIVPVFMRFPVSAHVLMLAVSASCRLRDARARRYKPVILIVQPFAIEMTA
jgi:hypothetical protein